MTKEKSERHVAFSSDAKGVNFLKVALHSLLKNAEPTLDMVVHVIFGGADFTEAVKEGVRSVARPYSFVTLVFHDVEDCFARHPDAFEHLMHFGRLFIGECIPKDVNVVYLDTDVLVLDDLEELFRMDLGDNVFAAVSEAQWNNGVCDPKDCDLIPPEAEFYFNSGVMVFNLKAYREGNFLEHAIAWHKGNHVKSKLHDQNILNWISVGKVLRLPLRFNYSDGWLLRFMKCGTKGRTWRGNRPAEVFEAIQSPAVVHFVGKRKPWRKCHRPLRRLYRQYMLDIGWDPPADPLVYIVYDFIHWLTRRIAVPMRAKRLLRSNRKSVNED